MKKIHNLRLGHTKLIQIDLQQQSHLSLKFDVSHRLDFECPIVDLSGSPIYNKIKYNNRNLQDLHKNYAKILPVTLRK